MIHCNRLSLLLLLLLLPLLGFTFSFLSLIVISHFLYLYGQRPSASVGGVGRARETRPLDVVGAQAPDGWGPLYFFSLPFSHFSLHPLNPKP